MALALILIAGLATLDDYGVTVDEPYQRWLPTAILAHITGEPDALPEHHNRFYGAAFEAPLLLAERAFGLEEKRSVWLARHLLTHLFFLTGGLFAYLLASRLFGNRAVALFAMLLFLLHPRIYAHSFFNSKDVPFSAMFMIALFLTHRAFVKDKPSAFALLGVGVGILLNLRIMGIVLPVAVLALQALDIFSMREERRGRALISAGIFVLAAGLTVYILLPVLWPNPVERSLDWWSTLSSHPIVFTQRFMGMDYETTDFPWNYVPVWFSITSPPFALLLGLVGATFILGITAKSRGSLGGARRFGLLLVGCAAMPVAAVILFDANIFTGWRHVYFLWAPFSLLAGFGLQWTLSTLGRSPLRMPALAVAAAGLSTAAVSMALIHPNQHLFFNFFVDRVAPGHLARQYELEYWGHPIRQSLEWFADNARVLGDGKPASTGEADEIVRENMAILPSSARERIARNLGADAFASGVKFWARPELPTHSAQVYANTILTVQMRPDLRAVYERVASKEPNVRSLFDVYLDEDAVVYVKEPCAEGDASLNGSFTLEFFPHRNDDLRSANDRIRGFASERFKFSRREIDGRCVAYVPAPRYSIAVIRMRQHAPRTRNLLWEAEFRADLADQEIYERVSGEEPAARSIFDVYASDGAVVYAKDQCGLSDVDGSFFLHVFPSQRGDLPADRRQHGFDNIEISSFLNNGAIFDGKCVASVALPEYEIVGVRTGQTAQDGSAQWSASFSLNDEPHRAAYADVAEDDPLARGLFDIYLADGGLTYVKESCGAADMQARFFLHLVPERANDLQIERQETGFDNLDFDFFLHGAAFDGKCAGSVALPEYEIAGVRTGQLTEDSAELWSASFTLSAEPYRAAYRGAALSEPVARGAFDVHLTNGDLVYVKEPCEQGDADARFFLHIIPERVDDLPDERREHGFDNLDFDFFLRGAAFDGKCVARVPLPDYPIRSVRTGQYGAAGEIWGAEFEIAE